MDAQIRALLFLLLLPALLAAQREEAPRKSDWIVIPVAYYTPETSLGGGAKYIHSGLMGREQEIDIQVLGTIRGQYEFEMKHTLALNQGPFSQNYFNIELFHEPEQYFGLTNEPTEDSAWVFTPEGVEYYQELTLPLGEGPWVLRPGFHLDWVEIAEATWEGVAVAEARRSELEARLLDASGLDLFLTGELSRDTRNSVTAPSKGFYGGIKTHAGLPGSTHPHLWWRLWSNLYLTAGPFESAFQLLQEGTQGDAAFYSHPFLGSATRLRGVLGYRLRGDLAQMVRGEGRYNFSLPWIPFPHRLQVALFGATGRVAQSWESLWEARIHPSGGLGGRLILKDGLAVIRGDVGFSEYGQGVYLGFGQVF